jgi:glycosyltransferase involved in cell wall biosynthesis
VTTASVVIATFGDLDAEAAPGWTWRRLRERAIESTVGQGAEVVTYHDPDPNPCALGRSRNAAIEAATGEWVLALDADDELAPGCVAALLAAEGDVRLPAYQYGDREPMLRARRPYVAGVAGLMRREHYLAIRYREDVEWGEDNDLWHRAALLGLSFADVPEAVYRVHVRPGSRRMTKGRDRRWAQMRAEAAVWARGRVL